MMNWFILIIIFVQGIAIIRKSFDVFMIFIVLFRNLFFFFIYECTCKILRLFYSIFGIDFSKFLSFFDFILEYRLLI